MKFLVTTSKRPSKRARSFIKDLAQIFISERIVRGKKSLDELKNLLIQKKAEGILIVDTKWGNPSRIRIIKNDGSNFQILLKGVKLLRELREKPPVPNNYPAILANNEKADKLSKILNLETVNSLNDIKGNINVIVLKSKKDKQGNEVILLNIYNSKTKKFYGPFLKIINII